MSFPEVFPGIVRERVVTPEVALEPGTRVGVARWYTPGRVELRADGRQIVTDLRSVWLGLRLEDGFVGYVNGSLVELRQYDRLIATGFIAAGSIVLANGTEMTVEASSALAECEERLPSLLEEFRGQRKRS